MHNAYTISFCGFRFFWTPFIKCSIAKECDKKLFGSVQSGYCYYDKIQARDRVLCTLAREINIDQLASRSLDLIK